MRKNIICLWYDGTAEEAARFYAQTFPDSAVTAVHQMAAPKALAGGARTNGAYPGRSPHACCWKQ